MEQDKDNFKSTARLEGEGGYEASEAGTTHHCGEYRYGSFVHHDVITSRQPSFPSEYSHRQGNAVMIDILGFIMATLASSLLQLFQPLVSMQPFWLYLATFGGIVQIYAAHEEFLNGNSVSATILFLYAFHFFATGILVGDLAFLKNIGTPTEFDGSALGCYYIAFNLFNLLLTLCTYLSPKGSWILVVLLIDVQVRLVMFCIYAWWPTPSLNRASGFFGVVASLMAIYIYYADAMSEDGIQVPTGKFHPGVKTREDVKGEIHEIYAVNRRE
jgi:succinate-acetate transporter protein